MSTVDIHGEMLKTADTIKSMQEILKPHEPMNFTNRFSAPNLENLSRPVESPRASSNEQLLLAENKTLKDKLQKLESQNNKINDKLTDAYKEINDWRRTFEETLNAVSKKGYELQTKIYEICSKE